MSGASDDLDNELWDFALRFYGRPGIAASCLALQNRLGLDVNLLLLALFADLERDTPMSPDEIAAADAAVSQWRGSVVQALRRIRSDLKEGPPPAPSPVTDRLREEIKKLELRAEQIQLAVLQGWLDERSVGKNRENALRADPATTVARHFGGEAPLGQPEVAAAIRTISEEASAWRAAKTNT